MAENVEPPRRGYSLALVDGEIHLIFGDGSRGDVPPLGTPSRLLRALADLLAADRED